MLENNKEQDIVLAKFIKYMTLVLDHRRIDYLEKLHTQNSNEQELNDDIYEDKNLNNLERVNLKNLSKKEREIIELLYIKGYSYSEISNITKDSISALYKRRDRAILKLKREVGDNYEF